MLVKAKHGNFAIIMKRAANIFTAIFMAFTIVCLGNGISVLHCLHMGTTSMVMTFEDAPASQCCSQKIQKLKEKHSCCETQQEHSEKGDNASSHLNPNCMDVQTLKLSPSTMVSQTSFDLTPLLTFACPFIIFAISFSPGVIQRESYHKPYSWHSPPRNYLVFIRVLQI